MFGSQATGANRRALYRWVIEAISSSFVRAIVVFVLLILPCAAKAVEEPLLLEVFINGRTTKIVGEFILRDAVLLSKRSELTSIGLQVPRSRIGVSPDDFVVVSDMPGVSVRLDQPSQSVFINTSLDQLRPAVITAYERNDSASAIESGLGATLNYDVTGLRGFGMGAQGSFSGAFDGRVFTPWGVGSTTWLAFTGGVHGARSLVRLDSSYAYSDPTTLTRYDLGDFVTSGLTWTRPVRFLGVQISSDFSIRPDLVTFPLPTVSGAAAVPSTLDVLTNGNLVLSRQIEPGPFAIAQVPVLTGANDISMTVTNAIGQQVSVSLPFYASSTLLTPGLQSFSAQAGFVRRAWGVESDDYGRLAASFSYRRGLFPFLTVEASGEATPETAVVGAGVVVNLANRAVLNAAAAVSHDRAIGYGPRTGAGAGTGTEFVAGIQHLGRVLSLSASATVASRNYSDIAAIYGSPAPRLQLSAGAGLSLGRHGSLSLAYATNDLNGVPAPIPIYVAPGTQLPANASISDQNVFLRPAQFSRVFSVSYSVPVGPAYVYSSAYRDTSSQSNSGLSLGISVAFGRRASVGGGVAGGPGGVTVQAEAQQSAPSVGDWGYQAYATEGSAPDHTFAQVQYKANPGLFSIGVDNLGSQTTGRIEAQGAFSIADGHVFASNTINDSFAVVDTNGLANVEVLDENRDMGRTDAAGLLLVPELRAFAVNHLAIDPTDVPLDVTLNTAMRGVRPQDRSGVVVKFAIKKSNGALLHIVDKDGKPMVLGSAATLVATGVAVPIGYDGEAYVEELQAHNKVRVEKPNGLRCTVEFDFKPQPNQIPTIGPLPCREPAP